MGSRFATVQESPLHDNIKQNVISKDQHDTIFSPHFDGLPARYMKTPLATKLTRKPINFFLAAWQALFAAIALKVPVWKVMAGLLVDDQSHAPQKLAAQLEQNRQDNLAAYASLLKQGIKPIKPNPQELLEWQKSGGMATERIQKAGLISPAMLQVLDGHLKTFRTNQKS